MRYLVILTVYSPADAADLAEKYSYDTAGDNAAHVDTINLRENRSFINICKEKEFPRELTGKYKI